MNDTSHRRFADATKLCAPEPPTTIFNLGAPNTAADFPRLFDILRRATLILLPLALVTLAALFLLYRAQVEASRLVMRADERNTIAIGVGVTVARLTEVVSDLAFLPEQWVMAQWLQTGDASATAKIASNFLPSQNTRRSMMKFV